VDRGAVRLDGVDVRELVSQDVYLFHGTVRENIAYGAHGQGEGRGGGSGDGAGRGPGGDAGHHSAADPEVPLERVVEAARLAHLDAFVRTLPQGYDTLVGERGIKLSGGQRQRLSLARAILKDAPVLVLDEATSSVDTETERAIQESLRRLTAGRTALVIAHRLSTIRHADRPPQRRAAFPAPAPRMQERPGTENAPTPPCHGGVQ
jgi:ATP-binding cassette, subfamily B, bacterial